MKIVEKISRIILTVLLKIWFGFRHLIKIVVFPQNHYRGAGNDSDIITNYSIMGYYLVKSGEIYIIMYDGYSFITGTHVSDIMIINDTMSTLKLLFRTGHPIIIIRMFVWSLFRFNNPTSPSTSDVEGDDE